MRALLEKLIKPKVVPPPDKLAWLYTANELDDISALQKSNQFLGLFYEDLTIDPSEKIKMLMQIDRTNRLRIETLISQFGQLQNLRPELEASYFDTAYTYQRHLYRNYQNIVNQYFDIEASLPDSQKNCHIFIARALHALFESHKLRYFRLQAAPDGSWLAAYSLYLLAEDHGFQDKAIKPYRDADTTTISSILAQGCMLDTLYQSNLPKAKIEIASFLLKKLLINVALTKSAEDDNVIFFVDTKLDKGARRIRQSQLNEACHFWKTASLSLKLHKILLALHQKKDLSATIIGPISKHSAFPETLIFLNKEWSKIYYERQRRKEERLKINKRGNIIYGFESICDQVRTLAQVISYREKKAYAKSEKSLDEKLQSHNSVILNSTPNLVFLDIGGEIISVVDESNNGFGLTIQESPEKWAANGKLVALSLEENREQILVCLVRSVRQQSEGDFYIGLEKLTTKPFWVNINHLNTSSTRDKQIATSLKQAEIVENSILGFSGLYFTSEFDESDNTYLILPRLELVDNGEYQINLFGSRHNMKLEKSTEIKDDWALARVKMLN